MSLTMQYCINCCHLETLALVEVYSLLVLRCGNPLCQSLSGPVTSIPSSTIYTPPWKSVWGSTYFQLFIQKNEDHIAQKPMNLISAGTQPVDAVVHTVVLSINQLKSMDSM